MNNVAKLVMSGLVAAAAMALTACESSHPVRAGYVYDGMWIPEPTDATPAPAPAKPAPAQPMATKPAPMPAGPCNYMPNVPAGWGVSQLAFPTGDVRSSALLVHEIMPGSVRAGQTFSPEIHVTNITGGTLQNVMLETSSFRNFNVASATPSGTKTANGWSWPIGDMGPCKTIVIKLTGTATEVGTAGNCLTVSYANALCAMTQVVQPALAIEKTITPTSILGCDPINMTVTVKNTGSGDATNVVIKDALPAGLMTTDGKSNVEIPVGTLAAGQSKPYTVALKAAKTGKYDNTATATADGNMTATSQKVTTVVTQPVLSITCKSGAAQIFLGRDATFDLEVKNTGDAACSTTVSIPMPSGATFVKATEGGAPGANGVTWNFGAMAPNATKSFSVTFKPSGMNSVAINATATCPCAAPASTSCSTNVVGIPALLLDGGDDPDPIQIGETTTYTLKVTNQGSANLTNVKLVCTMVDADSMEYVSSTGGGTANGATVSFPLIATLAPKQSMTYTVKVKAKKEGQVSFKAEASSTEITRALIKTETTNFYK